MKVIPTALIGDSLTISGMGTYTIEPLLLAHMQTMESPVAKECEIELSEDNKFVKKLKVIDMTNTITAKVSYVAKTGGIKIDGNDSWYNPTEECKAYVKPDMKGCTVELTLTEEGANTFRFIKKVSTTDSQSSQRPDVPSSDSSDLQVGFFESDIGGDGLVNQLNTFSKENKIKFTQTHVVAEGGRVNHYAYVWYSKK